MKTIRSYVGGLFREYRELRGRQCIAASVILTISVLWPLAGFTAFVIFRYVFKDKTYSVYGQLGMFGMLINLLMYLVQITAALAGGI